MENKGKDLLNLYYLCFGLLSSMNVTDMHEENDYISYNIHNMSNKKVVNIIYYYETNLFIINNVEYNILDIAIIAIAQELNANIVESKDTHKYTMNFLQYSEIIKTIPLINFLTFLSTFANNIKIVSFCKHIVLDKIYKKSIIITDLTTNLTVTIYDYGFTCSLMDEELVLPYDKMIFHIINYFNIKSLTQIDSVRLN